LTARRFSPLLAASLLLLTAGAVRGADEITIRGAYYREPSTRVIQPVVEIHKDLPNGFDVDTHYLLDAITSASSNAGVTSDSIFTEIRNEVGLGVGKTWERTRASLGYKYSAESDYWSHAFFGSLSRRLWGDTGTLGFAAGISLDQASSRNRTPACATPPSVSCPLDTYFAGLAYTQVLSPVATAQLVAETAYLDGFQGNLYRVVPNFAAGFENPPDRRLRNAVAARAAYYFPDARVGLQLHYRFYWDVYPGTSLVDYDAWAMRAHTIEARAYVQLTPTLEVRILFREHLQNHAAFWCDVSENPTCYTTTGASGAAVVSPYQSSDPKLGPIHTEYPEVKLIWQAEAWHEVPFFRWFSTGTFELAYGRYFQNDSFGDAHVLQAGYTMPY
jgi:hypothetical protein